MVTSIAKAAHRDLASPSTPSHPNGSPDFRILQAWINAEQASESPACLTPILAPTLHDPRRTERCEECASCRRHHDTVVAEVESAIRQCRARQTGQAALADLYAEVPAWLRPFFGYRQGEGLKRLLGTWERKTGVFLPGEVPEPWRLTEDEATVYWWELRGWMDWEMQRELTPGPLRHDRRLWVRLETVHERLLSAGDKVRSMFGFRGSFTD